MNPISTPTLKVSAMAAVLGLLLALNLLKPGPTAAGPTYGLTPTPTPTGVALDTATPISFTPTPAPTSTQAPGDDGQNRTATIDVEFGCNEICGVDGQVAAIQGWVQLIHQGSGWIAEGTISNRGSTQFQVPYTGQYDVYLTQLPTAGLEVSGPLPKFLGVVEANAGLQLVACPGNCPTIAQPTLPPPAVLPQTGQQARPGIGQLALVSLLVGLLILGAAWLSLPARD